MPFDQLVEQKRLETLQGARLEVSTAKGGVLVISGWFTPEAADQTGTEQQQ
jgi:hypothetical protein